MARRVSPGDNDGLVIVRHKVQNFATWKRAFESHAPARALAGLSNARLYRSADDSSEVVILLDKDDIGGAGPSQVPRRSRQFQTEGRPSREAVEAIGPRHPGCRPLRGGAVAYLGCR